MIYKTSYFRKELRQAYAEDKAGTGRKLAFALFLGLLSFAVFFMLQSLKKSVLSDAVPEIMQASYFSTVYIYIHLAFVLNSVYFILYYDYLFFSEIRKNSWYLLIKMGYRPTMMIFQKFIALLSSVLFIYTVGFCLVILLTALLKYNFIYAYLPSLYFSGLLDLFLISALAMSLSLFIDTVTNARYLITFSSLAIPVVKAATGYYSILSNRATMQNIGNLFDVGRSAYILVAGFLTVACCFVSIFRANNLSRYYILRKLEWSQRYPEITVGRMDTKTGYPIPDRTEPKRRSGLINTVITAVFILFICLALLFNGFIILLGASAPGNEVTVRGTIPYIFESDTMQPEIMYNDLTFFRRVGSQYPVLLGQIVLFRQDKVVYVERIIEISGAGIKVDIDNYPPLSETGSMLKTIRRQDIYGVYDGRNRWLGALILFSNTLVGRIVFLLLPSVLLFYRKQVLRLLKKITA